MKYLLLVCHDDLGCLGVGEKEGGELLAESIRLAHALDADGRYILPRR